MKKTINYTLILFVSIVSFYSCKDKFEPNVEGEKRYEILATFEDYLVDFQPDESVERTTIHLSKELDYSKNYEASIFTLISEENGMKNAPGITENTLGYSKPTEFDRHFVKHLLEGYNNEDASIFFQRADYFELFVTNNVHDLAHKEYLINILEQFKWIKYSVLHVKESINNARTGRSCFDDCMESAINEQLDWWGGWVEFLLTPASTTAWMAAECISGCHF